MNTDILIIGAGPAGIFTAMELLRRGSRKKILLVEKGRAVEERRCPKAQTGRCMNCKPYCPSRPRSAATCRSSSATTSRSP